MLLIQIFLYCYFVAQFSICSGFLYLIFCIGATVKVNGFHQGILKLAMEPSLLGAAVMEGGPDRKIKLDRSPGVDEVMLLMFSELRSISATFSFSLNFNLLRHYAVLCSKKITSKSIFS